MLVILYQVGIFIAIQIAASFGKNSRNTAVVLISIFTFLQVYMSWLLVLQFFTIYLAYRFSSNRFKRNKVKTATAKTYISVSRDLDSLFFGYRKAWEQNNPDKGYFDYIAYLQGKEDYDSSLFDAWKNINPDKNMLDYINYLSATKYQLK